MISTAHCVNYAHGCSLKKLFKTKIRQNLTKNYQKKGLVHYQNCSKLPPPQKKNFFYHLTSMSKLP